MSEVILTVLGITFAASAIWLTMRIINRREQWAIRTGAAVSVVMSLYPPSIGPMWWLIHQSWCPEWGQTAFSTIYYPIIWLYDHGPQPARQAMESFATLWWQ